MPRATHLVLLSKGMITIIGRVCLRGARAVVVAMVAVVKFAAGGAGTKAIGVNGRRPNGLSHRDRHRQGLKASRGDLPHAMEGRLHKGAGPIARQHEHVGLAVLGRVRQVAVVACDLIVD